MEQPHPLHWHVSTGSGGRNKSGEIASISFCFENELSLRTLAHATSFYQLHYISPLIYTDKKVPADQSAVTVVSLDNK